MGRWGVDCLFKLPRLYRDSKTGEWQHLGYFIQRIKNAESTPKEFAASAIRSNIEKAKQAAKGKAGFWRRVRLECAARVSGIGSISYSVETLVVRAIARLCLAFGVNRTQAESVMNELIARRFPGARVRNEGIHESNLQGSNDNPLS